MPTNLQLEDIERLLNKLSPPERIADPRHRYALRRAMLTHACEGSTFDPVLEWFSATRTVLVMSVATVAIVMVVQLGDAQETADIFAVEESFGPVRLSVAEETLQEEIDGQTYLAVPRSSFGDFRPLPASEVWQSMREQFVAAR